MPASSDPATTVEQVVTLARHLHARPAGQVVRAAARFPDTTIELGRGGRTASARSILAVMGLGAVAGDEVRIRAAGADPVDASAAVAAILVAAEE
ncbi:MAG TPA: HPr family phosphocarrier protein [Micromonosporaceae bacterium]|nr:HPr family phosphocarrier protein [Micromonosporaceae bacterium]